MADFISEFRAAMARAGMIYSGEIRPDGVRHRFNCEGESGDASWYRLWHDHPEFANGVFGCWRRNISEKWNSSNGSGMTKEQHDRMIQRMREAEHERKTEEEKVRAESKLKISQLLSQSPPANDQHPYLLQKRVSVHGEMRCTKDGVLLLPMRDMNGAMQCCQLIAPDKRFPGGRNKSFPLGLNALGAFYVIGEVQTGPLVICEGYATGASIHEATGWHTVCAMMTANLLVCAQQYRKLYPNRTIVIAGDNDRFTHKPGGEPWNPGLEKAREVAKAIEASLAFPPDNLFSDDSVGTDFNDLALEAGLSAVATVLQRVGGMSFLSPQAVLDLSLPKNNVLLGDHVMCLGNLMTILAPGGTGKSTLIFQLAAAVCARHERFLAFDIHPDFYEMRWLIVQAENSPHRMKRDMARLREWIGMDGWARFTKQVHILVPMTDADSYLDLDNPEVFNRVGRSVDMFCPNIVVFDALYNFSYRELAKGAEMLGALSNCQRIAKRGDPSRVPVTIHHALPGAAGAARVTGFDRANYGRDSKVLHQLSRSIINIAPASEDDASLLLISCGKNNDGKEFSPFVCRRNPETGIFEIDSQTDVKAVVEKLKNPRRKEAVMTPARVRELCPVSGASPSELSRLIRDDCGCARQSSYRFIKQAEKAETIKVSPTSKEYVKGDKLT